MLQSARAPSLARGRFYGQTVSVECRKSSTEPRMVRGDLVPRSSFDDLKTSAAVQSAGRAHADGARAKINRGDARQDRARGHARAHLPDRKSTRLNSSHVKISYA